jgi:hypothetical protein
MNRPPSNALQLCLYCQSECSVNDLYCTSCGYILPGGMDDETNTQYVVKSRDRTADLQWGTAFFHQYARLYLRVEAKNHSEHVLQIPLQQGCAVIGRKAENADVDVDLTHLDALEMGISRRHAQIIRTGDRIELVDLGSANGTYLNRVRLAPNEAHILRNRAVIQLGQLILRVQFA